MSSRGPVNLTMQCVQSAPGTQWQWVAAGSSPVREQGGGPGAVGDGQRVELGALAVLPRLEHLPGTVVNEEGRPWNASERIAEQRGQEGGTLAAVWG